MKALHNRIYSFSSPLLCSASWWIAKTIAQVTDSRILCTNLITTATHDISSLIRLECFHALQGRLQSTTFYLTFLKSLP